MKKILAFAGSNSSTSINHQLVKHASEKVTAHDVTLIKLTDFEAPLFSEDLENESGIPASILQLKTLFEQHDAFMISSPEHNGMMPAFFKNTMDWISRTEGKIFQEKPVLLMSASPGPRGGQTNLANMKSVFPHWGASAVFAEFYVGRFYQAYDTETRKFILADDESRLKQSIHDFETYLSENQKEKNA
jgi:NAD(P)H-dependent FMN reductase